MYVFIDRYQFIEIIKCIIPLGNMFHAIVSVIAVNTQFNSPNIVRRSFNVPGILIKINIDQI